MGGLIARLLDLYGYLIIAYVIMSWFVMTNRSGLVADIYRVLASVCEPYVGLFRRLLPPIAVGGAGLDLSPLIALVVLQIVASIVSRLG
jgi:YggT family protein